MTVSIVTPLFNRARSMQRSIDSSLAAIRAGYADELVLVDDGSSDDTVAVLHRDYANELASDYCQLVVLAQNSGVSAAKNAGANAARGDWLIFLDSDDWFVPDALAALTTELQQHAGHAAVFFRCRDQQSGELIGAPAQAQELSLQGMLRHGTPGECLPVVKRQAMLKQPYPAELRGSEGLTYLALLFAGQQIYLSSVIAREYDNSGADRLSSKQGLRKRAAYLVSHNCRMLRYWRHAGVKATLGYGVRILYYSMIDWQNRLQGRR